MKRYYFIIAILILIGQFFYFMQQAFADVPNGQNTTSVSDAKKEDDDTDGDIEGLAEQNIEPTIDKNQEQNIEALTDETGEPPTDETAEASTMSISEQKAAFFKKAFGKEIPSTFYPHDMYLILDNSVSSRIVVEINPFTLALRFDNKDLIPFLEAYLIASLLQERFQDTPPPKITDEYLLQHGFDLQVDMKRRQVLLTSPLEIRKEIYIYLRSQPSLTFVPPDDNPVISGYVNVSNSLYNSFGYSGYYGNYNMNLNVQDWLFQSEFFYEMNRLEGHNTGLTGKRIVTDITEQSTRITIGDNNSPNTKILPQKQPRIGGFRQTIFGLDVTHTARLTGRLNRSNDFAYNFIVSEEVRLDIDINGRTIHTEILVPGKYSLQDFPLQSGKNDIIIRLTGENGILEEQTFECFYNPILLPPGQKEFQFVSGFPYEEVAGERTLKSNRFTNVAYWRQGISEHVGLSSYIQTTNNDFLFGGVGEFALKSNTISLEAVYSNHFLDQSGYSINLTSYSANSPLLIQKTPLIPSYYVVNFMYNSKYFDPFLMESSQSIINPIRRMISPSIVWQFTSNWQVQARVSLQEKRGAKDVFTFNVRSFYRTQRWLLNTTAQKTKVADWMFYTTATWRPKEHPRNRYSHRYNGNSGTHSVAANMWSEKNRAVNSNVSSDITDRNHMSQTGRVQYQKLENTTIITANHSANYNYHYGELGLNYYGQRMLMGINHSRTTRSERNTNIQFDTALAFAGKHWGISRPINNSFAILYANNEAMHDSTIRFQNGSYLDKYSAAVYPYIRNYQSYELKIDEADVPIGLDLGAQQYMVQGRLNSGQAIPVGKPGGIIMAKAILLRPNGEPFDLEVGTFTYVDDPELKIQFFTNRSGTLFVQGLKSGEYTVEILGDTYANFTIEIPKDAQSPFDLGSFKLQVKKIEK